MTCTAVERPSSYKLYTYVSATWTDITSDAVTDNISSNWGMKGYGENDRLAGTGQMTFTLNNTANKYIPGIVGVLAGWTIGVPVKVVITYDGVDYIRFRGFVSKLDPVAGAHANEARVKVTVLDWMDYAARYPLVSPAIQLNKTADVALTTILASMPIAPQATDFDTGTQTFQALFDTVTTGTKAYTEFNKLALSELGYIFLKKDATYGETLRFESATYRNGSRTVKQVAVPSCDSGFILNEDGSYLLNEDESRLLLDEITDVEIIDAMLNMSVVYGKNVINRATARAHPKKTDTSAVVLFSLDTPLAIAAGETITFKGNYSDPSGGLSVNAISDLMINPEGLSYTQPGGNSNKDWISVSSDSDGSNLISCAVGGRLYTSLDSGINWTERQPAGNFDLNWTCTSSDSDGSNLLAAISLGRLYTSSDGGANWTERQPAGAIDKDWGCCASDSDGSNLLVGVLFGRLYTSSDGGANWTERQPAGNVDRNWRCCASDSDGSNLIAGYASGRLYTSSDFGVTWTERFPAGSTDKYWRCCASDSDGSNLIAGAAGERLYTSSDFGATWVERRLVGDSNQQWYGAASDSDGSNLIAVIYGGYIYISYDSGINWDIYTDYLMYANSDGSGTDLTTFLTVSAIYGTEAPIYTLTNTSASDGYITKLQARGFGVYAYNPIEGTVEDSTSILAYGENAETVDQLYQRDLTSGSAWATAIVAAEKDPRLVLESVTMNANYSGTLMQAFLNCDVGDLVHVEETRTGIDGDFYIQNVSYDIQPGGIINFTWGLKEQL